MIKKVLVTGGGGYVGAVLAPKLLDAGFSVRILDAFYFTDIGLAAVRSRPGLEIVQGDIREEGTLR